MTERFAAALCALALAALFAAPAQARSPNPHKAAAKLVARMHHSRDCTFAHTKVMARRWLAVGSTCYPHDEPDTTVRVFRWSGKAWRRDGTVTGPLGPAQWMSAASLTGSRAPDIAIEGCGAGDTVCFSVVSKAGGRWHAVPFVYGYGTSLEVNGSPAGHRVLTEVNACGCAGGPSTWTYERYRHGRFEPTRPPGRAPRCSAAALEWVAFPWETKVLRFTQVRCAAGWAIAVGDGAGTSGPLVGLFTRALRGHTWQLLTLDAGNALPAAPALYDLPLELLTRLAPEPALAPALAAAKLIAGLGVSWPQQNGIVEAGGTRWLIAIMPTGPAPEEGSAPPAEAVIYRWDGAAWAIDGRVPNLPERLNAAWYGGWFVPVADPSAVALQLVGACCRPKGPSVLTNAGGHWHY
jgi:hypothetical protein